MELITKRELADHVRDVIIQLPKAKDLVVEIRRTKMEFIQNTVNSDLFKDDGMIICNTKVVSSNSIHGEMYSITLCDKVCQ